MFNLRQSRFGTYIRTSLFLGASLPNGFGGERMDGSSILGYWGVVEL